LGRTDLDDPARLQHLGRVLNSQRLLVVLDNFEDNQAPGTGEMVEPLVAMCLESLYRAANRGKLLLTSRFPVAASAYLARVDLGPLSVAETRKLIYRLPGLQARFGDQLGVLVRRIGGHPRMLEYLDGLLRRGRARLPAVTERLREQARLAGVDLDREISELDDAVRETVLIGAQDILLDELIATMETGELEALNQAAVSSLPLDAAGLAFALAGDEPTP
ncbi:MAG: hypothetical protein GY867_11320, partial [bacterium]|nr:hypothetical protein [bacterium]